MCCRGHVLVNILNHLGNIKDERTVLEGPQVFIGSVTESMLQLTMHKYIPNVFNQKCCPSSAVGKFIKCKNAKIGRTICKKTCRQECTKLTEWMMGSHIIYSMLWYVPIPTIYFNPVFIGLPPVLLQQYCSSVLNTLTVLSHGSISCILTALHGNHACICLDMPQRDHLVLVSCPVFSPPLTPVCCDWQFASVSTDKFQLDHTVAVR